MKTKLHLEALGDRALPSVFAGFDGQVESCVGNFNLDARDDVAYVAGAGGSCRVRVVSGSDGSTLLDEILFDPGFRGGGHLASIPAQTGGLTRSPDVLLAVPGVGGGPRVDQFDFTPDGMKLTSSWFAPFAESFRGGLRVSPGDVNGDGRPDALFLPAEGGGPQLLGIDLATHVELLSIAVGDLDDRSGAARFEATGGVINGGGFKPAIVIQYADTDPLTLRAPTRVWALDGSGEIGVA